MNVTQEEYLLGMWFCANNSLLCSLYFIFEKEHFPENTFKFVLILYAENVCDF